jgi:hypothetical protein
MIANDMQSLVAPGGSSVADSAGANGMGRIKKNYIRKCNFF